jgi:hypothetical protein
MCIPCTLTTLGGFCFDECRSLSILTFDAGSRLASIGTFAFLKCASLSSLCFPSGLRLLGDYALSGTKLSKISIADGNTHFKVIGDFLLDYSCVSIRRYFGTASELQIGSNIVTLGIDCFSHCDTVSTVIFGFES